jgi:hypothetical protein
VAIALVISARTSVLSILWLAVLVCSVCLVAAFILGLIFRNSRGWATVLRLMFADVLLGAIVAILDHMGYAH